MSRSPTLRCPDYPRAEIVAAIALTNARGVGPVAFAELCEQAGSPSAALGKQVRDRAERDALVAAAAGDEDACRRVGATILIRGSTDYPAALLDLPDPPPILFALGDLRVAAAPAVAIVGTRNSTAYGERVTRELASAFARAGACVVSGMARGIDAAAHLAAIAAGGRTAAVLGTGIDVPYPAAHEALHRRIAENGLVLSEHPPGTAARAGSFPRRNRIIAALAQLTIVVEAGHRSGALITAGHALDLDRGVAAVPGPIDQPNAAGSNQLLRDGAAVVATVDDALALLRLSPSPTMRPRELEGDALTLWEALAQPAADVDSLASRARLPARQCMTALTQLELAGLVECAMSGDVRRR